MGAGLCASRDAPLSQPPLLGYVVLAAGFVGLVYDGARSIANNGVRVTSLSDLLMTLFKERGSALQGAVESVAPWLWQALVLPLTLAPRLPPRPRPGGFPALARPAAPRADRLPQPALTSTSGGMAVSTRGIQERGRHPI